MKMFEFVVMSMVDSGEVYGKEYNDLNEYINDKKDIVEYIVDCEDWKGRENYDDFMKKWDNRIEKLMEYNDGNDDDYNDIVNGLNKIKDMLKESDEYICIEFGVEYDMSFMVVSKSDFEDMKKIEIYEDE